MGENDEGALYGCRHGKNPDGRIRYEACPQCRVLRFIAFGNVSAREGLTGACAMMVVQSS